jgi:hypothetical protein
MSGTLARVQRLVAKGEVHMSHHAMVRLDEQDIYPPEVLAGVASAVVVEDYPLHNRGACALVLQTEANGTPIHCLWGIAQSTDGPAVLITAYRPDPGQWSHDLTQRAR